MKRLFITAFCTLCMNAVFSQTKEESVRELILVMKQDSLIDRSFKTVLPMMHQQIQKQYGGEATKQSEELYKTTMEYASVMTKKLVQDDMQTIYGNIFTQAEIKDFIAFYKSPSGQKMLTALPEIQKQIMSVMMTKYMPELTEKIKQKATELKTDSGLQKQ